MSSTVSGVIALVFAGVFLSTAAAEAKLPKLKALSGVPDRKGQWDIEFVSMKGESVEQVAAFAGSKTISMCLNLNEDVDQRSSIHGGDQCKVKVIQNTSKRARLETKCGKESTVATLTRLGKKTFGVAVKGTDDEGKPFEMEMRYAYKGRCAQGDNTPSGVTLSPAMCDQIKQQMRQLNDAEKQCAAMPSDQRAACQAQLKQAMAQFKSMCPQ